MRSVVLAICSFLAFYSCGRSEASTIVEIGTSSYVVPQNGTINLSAPVLLSTPGMFDIVGGPKFSGSGFAVLTMNAVIDGATFSIQESLGTCPVSYCGSFPYVTDNVYGTHLGPGGYSTFLASNANDPMLTVSSSWTLQVFGGNITIPSDYQVQVDVFLPPGISAVPEPSTWVMMILGFTAFGFMAHRRKIRPSAITASRSAFSETAA